MRRRRIDKVVDRAENEGVEFVEVEEAVKKLSRMGPKEKHISGCDWPNELTKAGPADPAFVYQCP